MPQTARKTSEARGTKRRARKAEIEAAPKSNAADVFSFVSAAEEGTDDPDDTGSLAGDMRVIFADSNTTTLLTILYELVEALKTRPVFDIPGGKIDGP